MTNLSRVTPFTSPLEKQRKDVAEHRTYTLNLAIMVLRAEAEVFHGVQTNGLSQPAQMWCRTATHADPIDTIVKFRASVRNREFSLVSELMCSLLANDLGLPTPAPLIANLAPDVVESFPLASFPTPSHKDILRRSAGLNFASTFAGAGFAIIPEDVTLPTELKRIASEIFAFDIMIRNFDRKRDNPNLLWNRTQFCLIDHEAAFQDVQRGHTWHLNHLDLDRFYDHILFSAIDRENTNFERLCSMLGQISEQRLHEYAADIPKEWDLTGDDVKKVVDYLSWVIVNRQEICAHVFERIA